tara:strand:+ start:6113 stop:6490 length:378 start_codon:yes stop_codon:yes gene_type:complete
MQISFKSLLLILLLINVILFTGCSSVPKPIGEMAGAKAQLETAETNEAGKFAAVELDRAKSKLRRAEKAVVEKDYLTAKQLADEARSDAKLATAKASSARAKQSAQEMKNTVQSMKQEIERAQNR